jgi:crooked neck
MVEDWEMVFADDERESNPTSFKFLQMAHAWKNSQGSGGALSGFTAASSAPAQQDQDMDDGTSDVASSHGGDD